MKEAQNNTIATISYTRTEQYIENFEKKYSPTTFTLSLYSYNIVTESNTFLLEHILDISYKPFSGNNGLLYLHTNQGVFTFLVGANPSEFINAYKNLRGIV